MQHKFQIFALASVLFAQGCAKKDAPPESKSTEEITVQMPACCVKKPHGLDAVFAEAAPAAKSQQNSEQNSDADYHIKLPEGGQAHLLGLIDQNGSVLTLEYMQKNLKGHKLAIYFGFPDCTWFCPPSARAIVSALRQFPDIVPVFIASRTDPNTSEVYTPARMKEWIENAGLKNAIALTGPEELLARLYTDMQVLDANGNHVPYVGLVDERGNFLGGAAAVTLHHHPDGEAYLEPASENIINAIKENFHLQPQKPKDPAP